MPENGSACTPQASRRAPVHPAAKLTRDVPSHWQRQCPSKPSHRFGAELAAVAGLRLAWSRSNPAAHPESGTQPSVGSSTTKTGGPASACGSHRLSSGSAGGLPGASASRRTAGPASPSRSLADAGGPGTPPPPRSVARAGGLGSESLLESLPASMMALGCCCCAERGGEARSGGRITAPSRLSTGCPPLAAPLSQPTGVASEQLATSTAEGQCRCPTIRSLCAPMTATTSRREDRVPVRASEHRWMHTGTKSNCLYLVTW